jgi:hypothetical protein
MTWRLSPTFTAEGFDVEVMNLETERSRQSTGFDRRDRENP